MVRWCGYQTAGSGVKGGDRRPGPNGRHSPGTEVRVPTPVENSRREERANSNCTERDKTLIRNVM